MSNFAQCGELYHIHAHFGNDFTRFLAHYLNDFRSYLSHFTKDSTEYIPFSPFQC